VLEMAEASSKATGRPIGELLAQFVQVGIGLRQKKELDVFDRIDIEGHEISHVAFAPVLDSEGEVELEEFIVPLDERIAASLIWIKHSLRKCRAVKPKS
jgi:hypothetical protein